MIHFNNDDSENKLKLLLNQVFANIAVWLLYISCIRNWALFFRVPQIVEWIFGLLQGVCGGCRDQEPPTGCARHPGDPGRISGMWRPRHYSPLRQPDGSASSSHTLTAIEHPDYYSSMKSTSFWNFEYQVVVTWNIFITEVILLLELLRTF